MCDYVNKNELKCPKEVFKKMINSVQDYIRKQYKITFSYRPIGSGSRNMVIRKCNQNFFDLDYQWFRYTLTLLLLNHLDINLD